jgi:PadR family transcriptional regulator
MSEESSENGHGPASNGHRRLDSQAQPRSWLQPFLLLALEQWQSHGYELIRRMSAFGFEALDRGSVYRTLRQLEKDGLVVSGWDTSKDGPARRLYTLTDAGRIYLSTCAASLRGYQMMLNQFFSLYPSPTAPPQHEAAPTEETSSGNGPESAAKRGSG